MSAGARHPDRGAAPRRGVVAAVTPAEHTAHAGIAAIRELQGRLEAAEREVARLTDAAAASAETRGEALGLPAETVALVQALIGDVRLRADEHDAIALVLSTARAHSGSSRWTKEEP